LSVELSLRQHSYENPFRAQSVFVVPIANVIADTRAPVKLWTADIEPTALAQLRNVAELPFVFKHVAAMPDVHTGMGATVGSVIAMRGAIIPAAVGVDIGCFRGDTRIPLLDGTQATLEELAARSEPFWVYSVDRKLQVAPGRARCRKTRMNADVMRVIVSGGDEIVCTPDHEFMLSDGTYRQAKDLRFNDSLMALYRRWQTRDGYESVSTGKGATRQTHVMVWEAVNGQSVPPRHVVHHRNHIHFDNVPENLQLMQVNAHSAYHRRDGHKFKNEDPALQRLRRAGMHRRRNDPAGREQMAQVGRANIIGYMTNRPDHFKTAVAGNGKRAAPYLRRFTATPRTCGDCGEQAKNPAALQWHKRREHGYNHNVLLTQPLSVRADVYCLQVEDHHNFALAAGVFVHNCGMAAARLSLNALDLDERRLNKVFDQISRDVPVGFAQHKPGRTPERAELFRAELDALVEKYPGLLKSFGKRADWTLQLGTLGGGNHFIELCIDEVDRVWVMLHSGSRGIGNAIGTYFIDLARRDMERQSIHLPDRDLAYVREGSEHFDGYVRAVSWAQAYAKANRGEMLRLVLDALTRHLPLFDVESMVIDCHHNYVANERHFGENVWLTRKGAIRARVGDLGIIPGSMGARSYIVRGKGNPDSFESSAHGAGRRMSRAAANKRFTASDLAAQTAGVVCRKDRGVIDEIPAAYKSIDDVMANQSDLTDIVHTLKQVLCVKG
jgi:tRNA-splicing ligase RtcB